MRQQAAGRSWLPAASLPARRGGLPTGLVPTGLVPMGLVPAAWLSTVWLSTVWLPARGGRVPGPRGRLSSVSGVSAGTS